ncbi:MAG TPA: glycolate oxidase subunit GlcF [Anaerolineae bacterium]|nr:glycolate oxidase subunit GlcF [Anaerolineae bacterium]
MRHAIPIDQLGPRGAAMARAVEKCVHCGYCLATCPTYQVLGEEMDSPRGRIVLMKSALEGDLSIDSTLPFVDRCLGCLACVTTCPSGVQYQELVTPFRAHAEARRSRSFMPRLRRTLVRETLPYPKRFRIAARLGKLARSFNGFVPKELRGMLSLLPDQLPRSEPLPSVYPAVGQRRARAALLIGCVQNTLAPEINWATLRVLAHNGVEVVIPVQQGCCGALMLHTGEENRARQLARNNLRAFPKEVDAILTNAAGCGSGMKEYGLLFKGASEEEEAVAFTRKVKDVSVFLAELGIQAPPPLTQSIKLAYHDACHLAHAQGVTEAPRKLLRSVPNVTLLEIPSSEICCGSAGTYNIEQPEVAHQLGRRKAENILSTGCEAIAAGNIGCLVQIGAHLQQLNKPLPIYHTLEILDRAYRQI